MRVYSGLPAGGPTAGIFFTRWITHFVAPAFAFLAGTGAFFLGRKLDDRAALSRYLVSRGLVLVLLELTVLREAWTFNLGFAEYDLAGVIWMLGWCMVLMAALVRVSTKSLATFGLLVIFGQQLIPLGVKALPEPGVNAIGWLLKILYFGGVFRVGANGPEIAVLFVIVPWIGVMALGYAFGEIMLLDAPRRRSVCLAIGLSATAIFAVVATAIVAAHPGGPHAPRGLFRVLGQRKYPASELFLLMTLGPMIALIPLAEHATGVIGRVLSTFGRVPMFYYL
ncbi:MAG TPA: heparan-alpha-glucosaminide N-acetyltransferase domain-containing protein, partial [Gemmatimonadaceae bacterium]|nr:heparan-alpha-glucosaminide N-acetyltransferase domain-containing protein [Gemmatimonadaceae bacterium]